jgi:hypothetical protein
MDRTATESRKNALGWKLYDPAVLPMVSRNQCYDPSGDDGFPAYVVLGSRATVAILNATTTLRERTQCWPANFVQSGVTTSFIPRGRPALTPNGQVISIPAGRKRIVLKGDLTDERVLAVGVFDWTPASGIKQTELLLDYSQRPDPVMGEPIPHHGPAARAATAGQGRAGRQAGGDEQRPTGS